MLFRVVSEIVFLRGSTDIKHPMGWEGTQAYGGGCNAWSLGLRRPGFAG